MSNSSSPIKSGRVIAGSIIVLAGLLLLLNKADLLIVPRWLFQWEFILIVIGLVLGINSKFSNPASFILILIGGFFLVEDLFREYEIRMFFWPILIIAVGLWFIFGGLFKPGANFKKLNLSEADLVGDQYIRVSTIFGGVKRNVLSKNFKGAEVVTVFGGTDIHFDHTEIEDTAVMDVTVLFGGVTLKVPSHWQVKSEVLSIFGGVEDRRSIPTGQAGEKVLLIRGNVLFGGLDIKYI
jgi:predicted membrane protein